MPCRRLLPRALGFRLSCLQFLGRFWAVARQSLNPSSSAAFFGNHALRILARSGANKHSSSQPGGPASLPLAVCPSAACSPPFGAEVPHAIAAWLPVLRQSAHHTSMRKLFMRISRPAMIPQEEAPAAGSQLWAGQAQFHPVTQREFWRA